MAPEIGSQVAAGYLTYTDQFVNQKGRKLFCYYWEPKEKPRALLLICHGYTDHTMLYESLAEEMVKKRFFVFGNDQVGHGRSEGPRAHVNSLNQLVDDTITHVNKIQTKYPDAPLFIWGHSMGGAVSFLTSLQKKIPISGIVAVAPALAPNPETASYTRLAVARICGHLLPFMPVAYADVSLSCRNKEQIEKLNADPLRHHGYFKARSCCALLKAGVDILKNKEMVDVPYLILHGDNDKVCHISGSQTLHNHSSSKDKTFIIYPDAYHSLFQEPEDVSSDVLRQSVDWLDQRA